MLMLPVQGPRAKMHYAKILLNFREGLHETMTGPTLQMFYTDPKTLPICSSSPKRHLNSFRNSKSCHMTF